MAKSVKEQMTRLEPISKASNVAGDCLDEIEINGVKWAAIEGIQYPFDYYKCVEIIRDADNKRDTELGIYRALVQQDLFFIINFVLKVPNANSKFVVRACREVMSGPQNRTLDIWAREHFKSTILTIAEPIQKLCNNPEARIGLFSFTKANAKIFLRAIKIVLEQSALLKACFPDIFYMKPETEAVKWSEDDGLFCKRTSFAKEASISASGLIEGMSTGAHFTHRAYDDIETLDLVRTPDGIEKCIDAFRMSQFLGSDNDTHRVIGTFYHHLGVLQHIRSLKTEDGEPLYLTRIKPGTRNGEPDGISVLLSPEKMASYKATPEVFHTQILCNPTPKGTAKLSFDRIKRIDTSELPARLYKFMTIDPAGMRRSDNRTGDSWGIFVVGVEPIADEIGTSNVYIIDACIEPMDEITAINTIVDMYCKHGRILQLGIEKVGMSSMEVHVANALRARGKWVSLDTGNMVILKPAGREKASRIESALQWPLNNGKIFITSCVKSAYCDRLRNEMDRFPVWHDDGLDALSYVYDMLRDYRFPKHSGSVTEESEWERKFRKRLLAKQQLSWMGI